MEMKELLKKIGNRQYHKNHVNDVMKFYKNRGFDVADIVKLLEGMDKSYQMGYEQGLKDKKEGIDRPIDSCSIG